MTTLDHSKVMQVHALATRLNSQSYWISIARNRIGFNNPQTDIVFESFSIFLKYSNFQLRRMIIPKIVIENRYPRNEKLNEISTIIKKI